MSDLPTPVDCSTTQFVTEGCYLTSNFHAASINNNLQMASKKFFNYCNHWKRKVNPSKCEATFSQRKLLNGASHDETFFYVMKNLIGKTTQSTKESF